MRWFRRHYGAGPFHLVGLLVCFGVAAYAVTRVFGQGGWASILVWFAGCVILHDLIGWPLYALADRLLMWAARGRTPRLPPAAPAVSWVNHVRFPVVMSAVVFLISAPLIFRLSNSYYQATTGFNEDVYFKNWLTVTGILFALSIVVYGLRLGYAKRRSS